MSAADMARVTQWFGGGRQAVGNADLDGRHVHAAGEARRGRQGPGDGEVEAGRHLDDVAGDHLGIAGGDAQVCREAAEGIGVHPARDRDRATVLRPCGQALDGDVGAAAGEAALDGGEGDAVQGIGEGAAGERRRALDVGTARGTAQNPVDGEPPRDTLA